MEKIPVTNDTAMPIYVGSAMIPPGETRHFDEEQVPHHLRPEKPAEAVSAPDPSAALAELLEGSVAEVKGSLSDLSLEDVERLGEMEQLGQKRKTLLAAIADEVLNRDEDTKCASFLLTGEEEMIANLGVLTDSALVRIAEMESAGQNREAVLSAIAAEQLKRAG